MAVPNKEIRRRERVQRERQAKYEYEEAGKKPIGNERPNFKEYESIRKKYLMGNELTKEERNTFRKQADLIAQDLTNKTTLNEGDYYAWRALPTSLQAEVKNRRAAAIAKKYGLGDWRQFMTNAVPKVLGLAAGAAATPAGGTAGFGAGYAAGETLGNLGTALFNKFSPGGPQDPLTAEQRDLLRREALLDYYQPGQLPFYYEPQRSPEGQRAINYLRTGSYNQTAPNIIAPWMQSAVPTLQQIAAQPGAQSPGARQGITGLWNRIYGRRR